MLRIAIDGPGGAGKSTIAKRLAAELQLDYIDTGAMYRAVALKMRRLDITVNEEARIQEVLEKTQIDFVEGDTLLDGEVVSQAIRTPEMGNAASDFSALPVVRAKLVELQRHMGETKDCVMDGRDIGTNVLPQAECKIFLTADPEERARRRYQELLDKGEEVEYQQVLEDINQRDYNDTHRALNPLTQAEDAILVDTTHLSIDEVVDHIKGLLPAS